MVDSASPQERKLGSLSHLPWEKFHALLIGINEYPNWKSLKNAVRDFEAMHKFLLGAFNIPAGKCLDIRTLKDPQATAGNIIDAIKRLGTDANINQGDAIVIYFAGHGAAMPPPKGWPGYSEERPESGRWSDDHEIQCICASDARKEPSAPGPGLDGQYHIAGVVLDRTLNVLVKNIADKKGHNITVILDCCHSGSGLRGEEPVIPKEDLRSIDFMDEHGLPLTIQPDYQKPHWARMFGNEGRGAVLDWKYRHAGVGSHVVLAACSMKKGASDGFSFTQALIRTLEKKYLDSLSYFVLTKNVNELKVLPRQDPSCEGNNVNSYLFNIRDIQLGRPTFDVVKEDGVYFLNAGSMSGVIDGTQFDVFTSKATSIREELVGQFFAEDVGATSATFRGFPNDRRDLDSAVASPSGVLGGTYAVHIASDAVRKSIEQAFKEENNEDKTGHPFIDLHSAKESADLIVAGDMAEVRFEYPPSSEAGQLGVDKLHYAEPVAGSNSLDIRRVLRAGSHFTQFMRNFPDQRGIRLKDMVDVHIYPLIGSNNFVLARSGDLEREFVPGNKCVPGENGVYRLPAAREDQDGDRAPRYGIELVNRFPKNGIFVWMFVFNSSTFEILSYHEPRVAAAATVMDPTLPPATVIDPTLSFEGANIRPFPTALNFRNGACSPLKLQVPKGQVSDVSFIRIFLSTRVRGGGLKVIPQSSPLEYEKGHEKRGGPDDLPKNRGDPPPGSSGQDVPDMWDVLTIPIVMCTD